MEIRRVEQLKAGGDMVGNRTRAKIVKNKVAPPFKEAEFDIMFGEGISYEGDLLDLASDIDIIQKSGAWYAYNGEKIGQGRENAKIFLKDHPDICSAVDKAVREHYNIGGSPSEIDIKANKKPMKKVTKAAEEAPAAEAPEKKAAED
jgi:recombination protein RecA